MRNHFVTAVVATCLVAIAVSASEGEVNYRQHTMSAIGGHMRAIVDIIRGDVPHTDHLETHAGAMADLAEIAPTLFPESSKGGDALDAVWEDAEDFKSKLDAFREATANFKTAVDSGDQGQIMGGFRGVGQACKGCHDNYRAE
ncbi:MAG: cytochrome c [Gammaproteobacteria bacterium]|nr:cytochrome c [Gammaproteobacteria bacterium]MYJ73875.1 cytochrome c [Gammaproteobacteria bacterium]